MGRLTGIKKRWVINYTIIIFSILFLLEGTFIIFIKSYYYGNIEQSLISRAVVTTGFFNKYLSNISGSFEDNIRRIAEDYSFKDFAELQIVDTKGNLILSSSGFVTGGKISTKDYVNALNGKTSSWIGINKSTNEKIMAISSPLCYYDNKITGILRYVTSLEEVDGIIARLIWFSFIIIGIIISAVLILSMIFSRSIINPINEINEVANKMAKGQFSERINKRYNDEIGELAETLNYMAGEISKAEQLKNDFISSISHELRTPLTSIRGWGETLLTGELEDKEEMQKGLKIIIKETLRLSKMVEELLDFSKMQNGRMTLQLDNIDIKNELEDVLNIFEPRVKREGLELEYQCSNKIPFIVGDKNRLRQVFINILDNAIKFSNTNKSIYVEVFTQDKKVFFKVKDEGIGIKSDELLKVKQKFFKGKVSKAGNGIGLAVCDEIVRLHKGILNIESEINKGTVVTVVLPID